MSFHDAAEHNAKRVANGYGKNGEGESNDAELMPFHITHPLVVVVRTEHLDDVPGHEDAHGHGACIANEHLRCLAEDVVDEEGNECACEDKGEHGVRVVVCLDHSDAEHDAEGDAESAGEAVHTVNHVHGVNDAYSGKDGKGHGNVPRERLDAPKSVEAVDAGAAAVDDAEDGEHFDDDAVAGREVDDVIDGAYIEHHAHGEDDGEDVAVVADDGGEKRAADDAEEDGNASHYRDGLFL